METIFLHAPKVMRIGKRNIFTSTLQTNIHWRKKSLMMYLLISNHAPPPKKKSFSDAIHSLEDVKSFLDAQGYSEQATVVSSALDTCMVASLNCTSLASGRQRTLDECF